MAGISCENGGNPTAPSSPSSPPAPPVGPPLDTSFHQLVDGEGNRLPFKARMVRVHNPPLGSEIEDGDVFQFEAEVCFGPVDNPTNSPRLDHATFGLFYSADGIDPLNPTQREGIRAVHAVVQNGQCTKMMRLPPSEGGIPGRMYIDFNPSGGRYVMFHAQYGDEFINWWPDRPCPSHEVIANMRPDAMICNLRSASGELIHLDYKW